MKDILEKVFTNVNQWLHFAETKNAVLTTLNGGATIGVLGVLNADNAALAAFFPAFSILIATFCTSIILTLVSFSPTLNRPHRKPNKSQQQPNLIYYGHIACLTPTEFLKAVYQSYAQQDINPENANKYEQHLADQIVTNAQIAVGKYATFRKALWVDILGIAASLVSALVALF